MRRSLLSLLLLFAGPALASTPGTWDVGQQPISYPVIGPSGNFANQLGDGTTHGGLPPFFALQPADIPSTVTSQVTEGPGVGDIPAVDEFKLRLTLFGSHALPDDPLRNYCSRGASHLHEFSGGVAVGACSTFSQVRTDAVARHNAGKVGSTAPGDDVNASAYWHPALIDRNPLGDGVDRIKKVLLIPLYYQVPLATTAEAATFIDFPLGFGYVNGQNMDDPFDTRITNAIAAANAANVAAGGPSNAYQFQGNGFVGWSCLNGTTLALRDGTYDNIDDLTCSAGDILVGEIHGAGCADGKNLYSPSGYDHVMPPIRAVASNGNFNHVCPVGWYKIPELIFKPQWVLKSAISSAVANDSPYLSSDAAFQAKARTFAGHSTFVCKAGCSFHNDYFVAWQKKYLRRAFRKCLGIPWTDTSETGLDADQTVGGGSCNSNTLSSTSKLTGTHLPTPPTAAQVNGDAINEFYPTPVPVGHMGPGSISHSANDNHALPMNDDVELAGVAPIRFDLRRVGR